LVIDAHVEIVVHNRVLAVGGILYILVFGVGGCVVAVVAPPRRHYVVDFQAQNERYAHDGEDDGRYRRAHTRLLVGFLFSAFLEAESFDAQLSDGLLAVPLAVDDFIVVQVFFFTFITFFAGGAPRASTARRAFLAFFAIV